MARLPSPFKMHFQKKGVALGIDLELVVYSSEHLANREFRPAITGEVPALIDELQAFIRQVVHEELQNIIADPDKGLELTGAIEARLQLSLDSSDRIPFEEVKSRLNLF